MLDQEVIKLGLDICGALKKCENVHGAIKESKVFLANGVYTLGSANDSGVPCSGDLSCMAPEIYWGERYDHRADVYALGLLLYARLNEGCLPLIKPEFGEEQQRAAHLRRLEGEEISPPRYGSSALRQVVRKACAYEPICRYADVEELEQALREVL